jgi:hypothetical protein
MLIFQPKEHTRPIDTIGRPVFGLDPEGGMERQSILEMRAEFGRRGRRKKKRFGIRWQGDRRHCGSAGVRRRGFHEMLQGLRFATLGSLMTVMTAAMIRLHIRQGLWTGKTIPQEQRHDDQRRKQRTGESPHAISF